MEPDTFEVDVERAVAGGRMLARNGGRVVLVAGAVPGERVRVRAAKMTPHLVWADVVEVIARSPDRRETAFDPACGGLDYAHLAYAHQLACKAQILDDAFRRVAKRPLGAAVSIAPSPEEHYRLRARLHVRDGRAGWFREGTHELCPAASGAQLRSEALEAVDALLGAMGEAVSACDAVTIAENVTATERVLHLECRFDASVRLPIGEIVRWPVTGVTTARGRGVVALAGSPTVTDRSEDLLGASGCVPADAPVTWTRHATSFFQANRFLVGAMTRRVIDAAAGEVVADLYAGVGLFAVALAARGARVLAVEGDDSSASDLRVNASPWRDRLLARHASVETALAHRPERRPDAVIVDPPRTGLSARAFSGLVGWQPPRIVYVSCDPPTLARDAAKLAGFGYRLDSIEGFDLFPNTSHVETVTVFVRGAV